jgi:hypothetical protein
MENVIIDVFSENVGGNPTGNDAAIIVAEPKKRTYMREWKRKKYKENCEEMKAKNKAYYYKYKFNLDALDMKKYQNLLPLVAKIRKNLEELQKTKPEFMKDVLQPFLVD